jgi:DNA polymerase-3 subunit beta
MKFSLSREALLKPLQLVIGVVERRQTLPILSNVLFSLSDKNLSITGTDLEVEIVGLTAVSDSEEEGSVTISARKTLDICRSLPEGATLKFSSSEGKASIQSGKSKFMLSTLPASEFPTVDEGEKSLEFSVSGKDLQKLIESTSFAMAQQDVRYYLNGMLWELTSGQIRTVATDGHRMALADGKCDLALEEPLKAIVPRKGVVELQRLLDDDSVKIFIGTNHIRVIGGDYQFTSKLVDGAYPDYDRVLPKGGDKVIQADRLELKGAFGRAAILSNEKYRGVRLSISEDSLKIVANNPEQEEAQEDMEVNYKGEALEIGFNVSYLLDVFNTLEQRDIKMTLLNSNSSVLIESVSDESALYVVMPMRL